MELVFYIWLGYGPISVLLSVISLFALYRWKEFKSPFYRLVQCDLIINIVCYLHTWLKRISTDPELSRILIPMVVNAEFLLQINDFMSQCFYHIQSGSLLIKCVFRYTVAAKVEGPEIWKRNYPVIYLLTLIFSILYTLPYAFVSQLKTVFYNSTTDTITYSRNPWGCLYWIMDIQVGVYLLLTISIGIATWRKIKREWNAAVALRKRVTLVIMIDAIIHIAVWLWHYLPRHIDMSTHDRKVLLFCVSDWISCSTPYVLFLFDTMFRRSFTSRLFRRFRKPPKPTVGQVHGTNMASHMTMRF